MARQVISSREYKDKEGDTFFDPWRDHERTVTVMDTETGKTEKGFGSDDKSAADNANEKLDESEKSWWFNK